MALTNAERQRRYRQKLKALASGGAIGTQARAATERAIAALWAFHERPAPGGMLWAQIDGCTTLSQYRSELERNPGNLIQACRAFVPEFDGLTQTEALALAAVIDIADALRLAPPRAIEFAASQKSVTTDA